jgi:hypothetical protein
MSVSQKRMPVILGSGQNGFRLRENRAIHARKNVYLGALGRTISLPISLPNLYRNPLKITQQKDAHISVLLKVGVCHVFSDMAKETPNPHFHVGEPEKERSSDNWRTEFSDGEWPFTTHDKGMEEPAESPRSLCLFVLFPEPEEVPLGIHAVGKVAHTRHRHLARDEFSSSDGYLLHRGIDGLHTKIIHHPLRGIHPFPKTPANSWCPVKVLRTDEVEIHPGP